VVRLRPQAEWSGPRSPNLIGRECTSPLVDRAGYTYVTPCVYSSCMRIRTNIEIDEGYLRVIMDRYGIHTKTEAVDLALRHLAGQPMTREEALAMEGAHAIGALPADRGPE
jgi:Arc/MetJ family transcription regulator